MLRGDFSTMPLSDLLQWVDASRKSVVLEVDRPGGFRAWITAVDRAVVSASRPPKHGRLALDESGGRPGPGLRALAIESLLDLFFDRDGSFVLRQGATPPEPGVAIDVPIGFVVMEGLRLLDEWPRIEAAFADDGARLRRTGSAAADAAELSFVQRLLLEEAGRTPSLGELRLQLGLSRAALLRRIDELRSIGLVEVEGATPAARDPSSLLVEQALVLLRERQFAEATHVLRTLLSSSPGDRRLRRLLDDAEKRHLESCYERVAPTDLVRLASGPPRAGIALGEQALVDALAHKPRSVAGLVLVSPLRELETLEALLRLWKKGIVEVERGA